MTRYRCHVSDQALPGMPLITGFRLIECQQEVAPGVSLWLAEDDGAPASMAGEIIEPLFRTGPGGWEVHRRYTLAELERKEEDQ